ncbi:hypothetical protein [Neptuniibacter halophilus]|uniref:hypothetical protein n=1 Tax=Neptuniibacter halophilus TaxID=651666 RepID=UPI002573B7F1|nr:hypothetical protein [Neptuniibacter halophilus]
MNLKSIFAKRSRVLSVKDRKWLYDLLGFRARLGSLSSAYGDMITAQKKKGNAGKKKALILEQLQETGSGAGNDFHQAIKPFIPEDEYLVIAAAEQTGQLAEGLAKANDRLTLKGKHRLAIEGVARSFLVRFLMLVGLLLFVKEFLFDIFTKIKPVAKWEPLAQFTYQVADNLFIWVPITFIVLAGLVFALFWSFVEWKNGKYRRFAMDHLQPWALHRDVVAMSFLDSIGPLSEAYAEKEAIQFLKRSSTSSWVISCLNMMHGAIERGHGNPLANNPMMPEDLNEVIISMGDGGGKKDFYAISVERLEERVDASFKAINKVLDAVATTILYLFMGMVVLSYFSLSTSISQV